jgi:hypothetical protein
MGKFEKHYTCDTVSWAESRGKFPPSPQDFGSARTRTAESATLSLAEAKGCGGKALGKTPHAFRNLLDPGEHATEGVREEKAGPGALQSGRMQHRSRRGDLTVTSIVVDCASVPAPMPHFGHNGHGPIPCIHMAEGGRRSRRAPERADSSSEVRSRDKKEQLQ